MKVTKKFLNRFWESEYDYKINSKEEKTKVVTQKLPLTTTSIYYDESYLKEYKDYYDFNKCDWYGHYGMLKPEFQKDRPLYTIEITYTLYDITPSDRLKEEILRRKKQHEKLLKEYTKLADDMGI